MDLSAPGLFQRFTQESAEFFRRLLEELSAHQMRAEATVPTKLLKQFQAVILEDSSIITLPQDLSVIWKGCGGHPGVGESAVKLYVRWDVLGGHLDGPRLTDARWNDRRSPFPVNEIPAGSLYLADLGFFGLPRLQGLMQRQGRVKGYVITRLLHGTNLYLRNGHLLELRGILPKQVGEASGLDPEEWFSVISWARACGRMKRELSSPTFSTFEEKSLHSCLPCYCPTFPVFVWNR